MDTPICDFVRRYAGQNALRLHMPGHKGIGALGVEHLDITEIDGADSLYEAEGIIRQSERNASELFGCETLYSTEGSSLCIRAMLYLAMLWGKEQERSPLVLAGRNAHKTFLSAVALLDLDVEWLWPEEGGSYLSCEVKAETLEKLLAGRTQIPTAVYLTTPDYLGNLVDIAPIAEVCRKYNVLLLVDNAHGAYLRFLPESRHPIDLGAHLCCGSAHKTLGVLTGGAYLHLSDDLPARVRAQAKNALALFGSTSPSYLILQSLDTANRTLAEGYRKRLAEFVDCAQGLKERLAARGYVLVGNEPLKLTVCTKPCGYTGEEYAARLLRQNVVCEFADPDFVVLMLTPEIGEEGLMRLENAMCSIEGRSPLRECPPLPCRPECVLSPREAALSVGEAVRAEESVGRVLAAATVGCPPAVPIVVCGERIDGAVLAQFRYYGIKTCTVVKQQGVAFDLKL